MKKELTQLINSHFSDISIKIVLANHFKIGTFFNYKDRLPQAAWSSLVYKFSCAVCTASDYVGMTSLSLSARVAEHAGRSLRTGFQLSQPPNYNM